MSFRQTNERSHAKSLPRRQKTTHRLERRRRPEALPRDRCTLTVLTGTAPGTVFTVDERMVLGRDEGLASRIDDRGVSGQHACIYRDKGRFWLMDLDSTNGTHVHGRRIDAPYLIRDGDRIELGEHTLIRVSLQDAREQEASRRMYEAAVLDPLTGVYNRGHLETVLISEFAFAARHRSPLSVIFVDLDHFTEVNNTHGHQAGDAVLRSVARSIKATIRTEDLMARYGGEEFVLVARGIDLNGAIAMAERVRTTVERASIVAAGRSLTVTASFGVASFEAATPYGTVEELVAAADRAVYRAKASGRNCVCEAIDRAADSWRCA